MFFLLRCVFWLGLVFSQIAALEGASSSTLLAQGASEAGQLALDAAASRCRSEPGKCLELATQAATLGKPLGHDTLNSDDRLANWRLRTE